MNGLKYIALLIPLLLAACSGYTFGEAGESVLEPEYRTLAVDEVTNVATLSWVEPRIRSVLRDELNRRNVITWVDSQSKADAVITINVTKYSRPTAVSGVKDETLRSEVNMELKATIKSTFDGNILWESGTISQTWPFFTGQETEANAEVTKLIIRQLADKMTQNY